MKTKLYLLLVALLSTLSLSAQNIRYVSKNGAYANNGISWATAKLNIQDAINDLVNNGLTGEVWVAAGTYTPTESTESTGGSTLYMSFKIPAGITVRGGFRGQVVDNTDPANPVVTYPGETTAAEREMTHEDEHGHAYKNLKEYYKYRTILSGNLSTPAQFTWNSNRKQYETTFYGNCYHVVWFAMNGFDANGRAKALPAEAKLEGCVIANGHAYNNSLTERQHNAFGGGAYMVAGSVMENVFVMNCDASRDGGGIYMDGGGLVRRAYVADCQALGIGVENGYGGGICVDGNGKQHGIVTQTAIVNCVGRMGGGLALKNGTASDGKTYLSAFATVVNNNTAITEGGGVYVQNGGALGNLTIVRNQCNGTGVISNGMTTGRAGGLYCRDQAIVANTILWGNEVAKNNNIQYASSRSSASNEKKPRMLYCGIAKSDYIDWSGTTKKGVISLAEANSGAHSSSEGLALFITPTTTAGHIDNLALANVTEYNWQLQSESSLHDAGIQLIDLDLNGETDAPAMGQDINGDTYHPHCTLGAYVSPNYNIAPEETASAFNFYVDPEFVFSTSTAEAKGVSWDRPTRFLGNVLELIRQDAATQADVDAGIATKVGNRQWTGKTINIYVKSGTVDNTNSYVSGRLRNISLNVPSNVNIYGSYDRTLTGTSLSKRNPVLTPTVISARLLDDYDLNVAHLITLDGVQNVTIDGFKISYANAHSTELANTNRDGAAITIKGSTTGIHLRNLTVSNCQANHGAAVYADGSTADFENCIFHNNTSNTIRNSGLIYAVNSSNLTFNHCDVLRNVGYAAYMDAESRTVWTNTIFYGNLREVQDNTNDDKGDGSNASALAAFEGTTANATGHHCMFDAMSAGFAPQFGSPTLTAEQAKAQGGDTGNKWQYNLQYKFQEGTGQGYPRFINPTKNSGISPNGDVTYYGRSTSYEPHNNNPVVNMADASESHDVKSWGTDLVGITRDFGGLPDIGAVENHVSTIASSGENAYTDGQQPYGAILYVRDYNTYNADGTVQTTDASTANRDGSSWERAINGNANYTLSGTRKKAETKKQYVFKGYRIYTGTNYLIVNSGTLARNGTNKTGTIFALYDAEGNKITNDANIGNAKRLVDISTGNTLYLAISGSSYYFRATADPEEAQATATLTASGDDYSIQYTASNGQKRYIRNNNTLPSTTATYWTFARITEEEDVPTGVISDEYFNMGSFTGLQYAVNLANIRYHDDFNVSGGDVQNSKKQVWVGAGVYKRDPAKNTSTTPASPIIEMDNENCFIIQDGVDVYGAFPKNGNPGMDQRQALVSQYVHVQAERGITNVADYETILEPATTGVASGARRRVLGQPYKYNPDKGNDTNRGANDTPLYCGTDYVGVVWDGFTLRNGVWDSKGITRPNRYGGAGAAIYRNVTLKNVVVYHNTTIFTGTSTGQDLRAGGIYMDGGTLDAGYVINNTLQGWNNGAKAKYCAAYGGGMYIYTGTVFNSVIANNNIYATYSDGAGLFIENATFFNNTIVNNKAEGSSRGVGGIAVWTDENRGTESILNVYNSICVNNEGYIADPANDHCPTGNKNVAIQNGGYVAMHNCITEDSNNYPQVTKSGKTAQIEYFDSSTETTPANIVETLGKYGDTFADFNLRLKGTYANAINKGHEAPTLYGVTYDLSEYNDMDFADRIQDCAIDIGAYEFNGAYAITPDVTTVSGQAIFYVTPEGKGTASGSNPENAACASKLQKVIDAAGRYKYQNPDMQVIVKVANSYDMLHPNNGALNPGDDGYVDPTNFTYYACRTTDYIDQDVRVWSIIIPRGVEVWGGYTDVPVDANWVKTADEWDNDHNGFYFGGNDHRNIVKNPTYFDSYYLNKAEKSSANTYHVVSFSDYVFDGEGYPYMKGDESLISAGQNSTYHEKVNTSGSLEDKDVLLMSDRVSTAASAEAATINSNTEYISTRAVLDGIFVSGGKADGKDFVGGTNEKNLNGYGGAAIVTNYAHVRNCILKGNNATYGGALALKERALVSGCLMLENSADQKGGALYVFENGDQLSDGSIINTEQGGGATMDTNMSHVFTSTIVDNSAEQGGGVWFSDDEFTPNVRFNSVVIWQNKATDQANVSGNAMPNKPLDDTHSPEEYYPFAYSAIQNIRAAGTNNMSLAGDNKSGARFIDKTKDFDTDPSNKRTQSALEESDEPRLRNFGYYGLTNYSILSHNGMPATDYTRLVQNMAVAKADFAAMDRLAHTDPSFLRAYIEIGARALDKIIPNNRLMLRLFVSQPEDVDMAVAEQMMNSGDEYYQQEGSSFAYPFQSIQDALDYIYVQRNETNSTANGTNNLPFEICVSAGTYYPTRDLAGNYGQSLANTFAVPEGVGIYGGFATNELGSGIFYGAGNTPDIEKAKAFEDGTYAKAHWAMDNVDPITTGDKKLIDNTYTIKQLPIDDMLAARKKYDINANNIIEPWEFLNQTILSGNTTNAENSGVYHVITAVADQNVVGMLPKASIKHDDVFGAHNTASPTCSGYDSHEEGQTIYLNGITVTGGYAHHYTEGSLDEWGKYIYYQGGGVQIDGNRYNDNYNKPVEHPAHLPSTEFNDMHKAAFGVGYRDIPLAIINCKFVNNQAGYGGAISSNGNMDIFASSFEQNLAIHGDERVTIDVEGTPTEFTVQYPGNGGAILATQQLTIVNTLFANNEARSSSYRVDPHLHKSFRVQHPDVVGGIRTLDAAGGAIMMGTAGLLHVTNCNFVKNKANAYPAIFTLNPDTNPYTLAKAEGKSDSEAEEAMNEVTTPYHTAVVNSVFWGNEVHPEMLRRHAGNATFQFASQLGINLGLKGRTGTYNAAFDPLYAPSSQEELKNVASNDCRFQEMVTFSAYEAGRGFTPMNDYDCRNWDYKPKGHFMYQIKNYLAATYPNRKDGYNYQNCNIQIDSDNGSLEGPNFVNPSHNAGVDGYLESADWSPARLNNLTDNGTGRINQTIRAKASGEGYECTFDTYANDSDVPEDRSAYSSEKAGDYITTGGYTTSHYIAAYPLYRKSISLGEEYYMESAFDLPTYDAGGKVVPGVYKHQKLLRISYDPNPTHNQTYIDIGVYEYPHTELQYHTEGDEVDILWVSSAEKPDNGLPDGSAWTQPTSDLQRAIETLIASRNGHRKEIRLMDGTFTPIYTIDGKLSFYIDTYYQNNSVMLPMDGENPVYDKGITSFTIKGGYSRELNNQYDVDLYPAIIKGQTRTDANGDQWNHLLYIKDATQRYGKATYDDNNDYGAKGGSSTDIKTIPIEIDGITFINDQAKANVKGAAIYFEDQKYTIEDPNDNTISNEYTSTGTTPSHITVLKYYTDEAKTKPSTNNAPTPYYTREEITPLPNLSYPYADNAGTAKFIMSKCTVYGSGSYNNVTGDTGDKNTTSAVYVGKYGGHALLYNNVFHSNYGNPLVAHNAVTVNNTFALNGGFIDLENDAETSSTVNSSIKNSVLWRNNWQPMSSTYGNQFDLADYMDDATSGSIFDHNAYTGASHTGTDYAAKDASDNATEIALANYNVNLANENSDVIYGPNFLDPENTDLSKRNFQIMPSLRLLNKGKNELYKDNVTVNGEDYLTPVDNPSHAFNTSANIYDQAWYTTTQHDAGSAARFVNRDIDLGAYEYQQDLDRVIYVDPNKTFNGTGKDWSSPLGYGMIQDAIDLAAVYVVNHQNDDSGKEAYVFVKGASGTNKGLHTGEIITPRNGVQVYGSIGADFSEIAERSLSDDPETKAKEDDAHFDAFRLKMLAQREGVASNAASKTTVLGIHTNGTGFGKELKTLIDGFDVTATTSSNTTGAITEPVIQIKPILDGDHDANPQNSLKLALRNIIVHDNDATASHVNVTELDNALIYEVLMRDNKADDDHSVLKLGQYGWLVNGTIEGKTTGANGSTALNGGADLDAEDASHIYYSLVNYADDEATWKTLSGYNYPVEDKNLNYQLAENSKHIDALEPQRPAQLPATFESFINAEGDRDILGNPRYLRNLKVDEHDANVSRLDRGAFETWKVEQDFICGTNGTIHGSGVTLALAPQFYPHDGSVVYIMEGKSLVIDPVDGNDVKPTAHNPAFMLLQEGASCYGNGRPMTCAYLAVERQVKKTAGAVVSLPYPMDYKTNNAYTGVAVPTYDGNGILTLHADAPNVYTYDGSERADWQYTFASENSDCWKSVTAGNAVTANNGVLYVPNDATVNTYGTDTDTDGSNDIVPLRFTAKGASMTDYIYTETAEASKTVTLTQYNDGGRDTHENGNTDDNADFTDKDDMGWNAIGLPYLVSEYKPYQTIDDAMATGSYGYDDETKGQVVGKYMMHTPKTLWMFYDGKKYSDGSVMTPGVGDAGDGGFYAVDSWEGTASAWHVSDESEARIWVGEGFFTQTATLEPTETLTFYRPVYTAPVSPVKTERWYMTDEVRNIEETSGKRIVATRYYTPDGILQAKPVKGVTIQVDFYDDGSQKSHKYMKKR